ncbi:hypothetical protein FACS189450_12810 [Spirochaetia bacterium]|nr:hypothetical protein FACS189450_12810 [Spirochaetia bacterium]
MANNPKYIMKAWSILKGILSVKVWESTEWEKLSDEEQASGVFLCGDDDGSVGGV